MADFGPAVGPGLAVAAVGRTQRIAEHTLHSLGHLEVRSLEREEQGDQLIQLKKDLIVLSGEGHTTSWVCGRATGWLGVIGGHFNELSGHVKSTTAVWLQESSKSVSQDE